jgi:hypothetical protein
MWTEVGSQWVGMWVVWRVVEVVSASVWCTCGCVAVLCVCGRWAMRVRARSDTGRCMRVLIRVVVRGCFVAVVCGACSVGVCYSVYW